MKIEEFVEKVDQILRYKFDYTYIFNPANGNNILADGYIWMFDFDHDNNKGVCPSALNIQNYIGTSHSKGIIGLYYTSVLYHITPTGNHSLTTKSFDKKYNLKKLEKFNFEHLYKWAECQKSIYNNYTKNLKMKNIEEKINELNKDFK